MIDTLSTAHTFLIIYVINRASVRHALKPYRSMPAHALTRTASHAQLILGELTLNLLLSLINTLCLVDMIVENCNFKMCTPCSSLKPQKGVPRLLRMYTSPRRAFPILKSRYPNGLKSSYNSALIGLNKS